MLVIYGFCVCVVQVGVQLLEEQGIFVELIDVQILFFFDFEYIILEFLKKINCIVFMDEDVFGGVMVFMMWEVLEVQGGYCYFDFDLVMFIVCVYCFFYGFNGDYYIKFSFEDVFEQVYKMMYEVNLGYFLGKL